MTISLIGGATWDEGVQVPFVPQSDQCADGSFVYERPGGRVLNTLSVLHGHSHHAEVQSWVAIGQDSAGARIQKLVTFPVTWIFRQYTPRVLIMLKDDERTMVWRDRGYGVEMFKPAPWLEGTVWLDCGSSSRRQWLAQCEPDCEVGAPMNVALDERYDKTRAWQFTVGSEADGPRPKDSFLRERGFQWVVWTQGSRGGQYWKNGDGWNSFSSSAVTVVDSTGAGDAFLAGLLAGHDQGLSLDECCLLGRTWGGEACRYIGGMWQSSLTE